jgi:mannose-6-phosphate isomerase
MAELFDALKRLEVGKERTKESIYGEVGAAIVDAGYEVVERELGKPWGGYFRFDDSNADRFVGEFFIGVSPTEARLGSPDAPLSPKILVVQPGQRLSWQFHYHRAERWHFLTEGGFFRSTNDMMGYPRDGEAGEVVQFAKEERHRLFAPMTHYTIVAEIWQHTDPRHYSDEDDIVRIQDDYAR